MAHARSRGTVAAALVIGYVLGRSADPPPAVAPPAPPPPNGKSMTVIDFRFGEELGRVRAEVARLEAENAALRKELEPAPDRLDRDALAEVSRYVDDLARDAVDREHPEFREVTEEYKRAKLDWQRAQDAPEREKLAGRIRELHDEISRIRKPWVYAATTTKLLLESTGKRVGLGADEMRRIADYAMSAYPEIVRTTERLAERRKALRDEHPDIERDTFGDVVPKYRGIDPEFDRLCARRESLVREYHETWKAVLTPEQRDRLPR